MPDTLTIAMEKTFAASPEAVYRAWTDPSLLGRWIAPGHLEVLGTATDPRPGGAFRIDMRGALGDFDISGHAFGTYQEAAPGKHLRFTWSWHYSATGQTSPETVIDVELSGAEGGASLRLTHSGFTDRQSFEGYSEGWITCFGKLASVLDTMPAGPGA